jgi:predicted metalloprotease
MTTNSRFFRTGTLALTTAATFGASAATFNTPTVHNAVDPSLPAITLEITNLEVAASNRKVAMAHGALATMWSSNFRHIGEQFAVPGLARYRGSAIGSPCGVMLQNNAGYCPRDNTIYYDDVFLATQARRAANELGTDGDMAAVGIIAHEMGHAVAIQLGVQMRATYPNEAIADCLAGAFTDESRRNGSLESGDIEEAFFGMASGADPTPALTGNPRMDNRILRTASLLGHGTREQRTSNFRRGLDGGAGACLEEFRY